MDFPHTETSIPHENPPYTLLIILWKLSRLLKVALQRATLGEYNLTSTTKSLRARPLTVEFTYKALDCAAVPETLEAPGHFWHLAHKWSFQQQCWQSIFRDSETTQIWAHAQTHKQTDRCRDRVSERVRKREMCIVCEYVRCVMSHHSKSMPSPSMHNRRLAPSPSLAL